MKLNDCIALNVNYVVENTGAEIGDQTFFSPNSTKEIIYSQDHRAAPSIKRPPAHASLHMSLVK